MVHGPSSYNNTENDDDIVQLDHISCTINKPDNILRRRSHLVVADADGNLFQSKDEERSEGQSKGNSDDNEMAQISVGQAAASIKIVYEKQAENAAKLTQGTRAALGRKAEGAAKMKREALEAAGQRYGNAKIYVADKVENAAKMKREAFEAAGQRYDTAKIYVADKAENVAKMKREALEAAGQKAEAAKIYVAESKE